MLQQINSKKQGDVGVGIAIGWFAHKGYTVCVPLTDSQDYDLVVEIDSVLQKVQVRTTKSLSKYGSHVLNLRVCGGNRSGTGVYKMFDNTKVDYIFALTERSDMYLIPARKIAAKRGINVDTTYREFKVEWNNGDESNRTTKVIKTSDLQSLEPTTLLNTP